MKVLRRVEKDHAPTESPFSLTFPDNQANLADVGKLPGTGEEGRQRRR